MIDKINIPEFEVSEFNQALKEVIESNFNSQCFIGLLSLFIVL